MPCLPKSLTGPGFAQVLRLVVMSRVMTSQSYFLSSSHSSAFSPAKRCRTIRSADNKRCRYRRSHGRAPPPKSCSSVMYRKTLERTSGKRWLHHVSSSPSMFGTTPSCIPTQSSPALAQWAQGPRPTTMYPYNRVLMQRDCEPWANSTCTRSACLSSPGRACRSACVATPSNT